MKKIKLILNESLVTNKDSDVIEDTSIEQKPDFQIIDVTVIPDETYYPTIQSILIDLDEGSKLIESENNKLDINILSETVNTKTNYSNSLFEFESSNHTITLSLVLQESDRRGIYKVEAYTTRGVKVFESNTYRPKMVIESYLNSLANEYLIDKPLKEGYSLGDDKESFDVWDENNKKLEEIVNYVKQYADPKVVSHIENIEHSQDNINDACITLNGISDDIIGSDRDYDLYNELERNYPFINNIQAEHWYGKNICMVDFYIDSVYNKNKYGLCKVLNKVLEEFGDKNLKESVRIYDDEKDYSSELGEVYNIVADFINDDFMRNNKEYVERSWGEDHVMSGKVLNGIAQTLYNSGYSVSKDRVKHYANIGNNSAYEIFKDTECIGFLNVNSGLVCSSYVYLEDLNGNRYGGSWELRPANKWNIEKNSVVIYKEAEDPIKGDVKEDLNIEPGSDEEVTLDEIYEEPEEDKYHGAVDDKLEVEQKGEPKDYSIDEFTTALKLADDIYELNIDYSNWNDMDQTEREQLVTPELKRFLNEHKADFDKDPKLFDLLQYNLTDANFHTEAKVLRDLYKGGE